MKRIVYTSDLHYYHGTKDVVEQCLLTIKEKNPELVVFGGDIVDQKDGWEEFLTLCKSILGSVKCAFIAGNHDLWMCYHNDANSSIIFNFTLPAVIKKFGYIWLENGPISFANHWIVGNIGWYDYSAKPRWFQMPNEYYYKNKHLLNNDGRYVYFGTHCVGNQQMQKDDVIFANECLARLSDQISNRKKNIIVFTHSPVFPECVEYKHEHTNQEANWNHGCAYFYNLTMGDVIKKNDKVVAVVSGHTHRKLFGSTPGIKNPITYCVNGSDYGKPEIVLIDIDGKEIDWGFQKIELKKELNGLLKQ